MRAEAKRTSRTFVFHRFDNRVIGYYALSADVLTRGALPGSLAHGETDRIPAVLLARMAVDRRAHGHGLGRVLLGDAFARVSALDVGARYLIVDAIDEQAAAFYDHHAFRRIPGTLRLVHKTTRPL